jgi:superoxide dismutase, Fe-Mn family
MSDRRDFLKRTSLLGLAGLSSKLISDNQLNAIENLGNQSQTSPKDAFKLPKLPYEFSALEPHIDAKTMEIHYTKHHQSYVDKLNATPSTNIDYMSSDEVKCTHVDKFTSATIRNNLGGHYNHSLFWESLKPNPDTIVNLPNGKLAEEIVKQFKSYDEFKNQFTEAAKKVFGSGWCWLILLNDTSRSSTTKVSKGSTPTLKIVTTANQDNPLMQLEGEQGKPLLALDVWEHAYYLKHQNKRPDYISAWWNVVNWEKAQQLFTKK